MVTSVHNAVDAYLVGAHSSQFKKGLNKRSSTKNTISTVPDKRIKDDAQVENP